MRNFLYSINDIREVRCNLLAVISCEITKNTEPDCKQSCSVHFSRSVGSNFLWSQGLWHAGIPCPSPAPGACSDSCTLSWWWHLTISSSVVPFSFPPSVFPSIRVFSTESVLCIRQPKNWSFSFSISPSSEYLGLISFRIDWFDLL